MTRLEREAPLPDEMQGRWVEVDDESILIVDGGEVTCFGQVVEYDYKEVERVGGALTVNLKINDEAQEDTFQRANITGLVISPEGNFLAYNVKFGCEFVRERS
jgi:hypothetical protein